MNNRRLSSTIGTPIVDEGRLYEEIHLLLGRPSNYKVTDKGIWIISKQRYLREGGAAKAVQILDEGGNIIKTFPSLIKCAEALGKNHNTLTRWVRTNRQFN